VSTPRRAVVVESHLVAPGVRRVQLRVLDADRLAHRAGQYVLLHARGADESVVKRAYSIASPPAETASFDLCVRQVPGGPGSEFVHRLSPGTEVSFTGPWGKFVVDDESRDLVLVATGSAISCTGAILEDELARARSRAVRLYWGLRNDSDVHGVERLEALRRMHARFAYQVMLSRPGPAWTGPRGRVTAVLEHEARPDGLYFLAGNGSMIADAEALLEQAGVPAAAIRKEAFFTPGQVRIPLRERQARAANRARAGSAVVGVALHAGAPAREVLRAIEEALAAASLAPPEIRNLAAAAKASDEQGLAEAAAALGWPVEFYLPAELKSGGASISACEALARISAGNARLVLPKHRTPAVTVAIAAVAGVAEGQPA
jgi:ferredoxin-NADP reductase